MQEDGSTAGYCCSKRRTVSALVKGFLNIKVIQRFQFPAFSGVTINCHRLLSCKTSTINAVFSFTKPMLFDPETRVQNSIGPFAYCHSTLSLPVSCQPTVYQLKAKKKKKFSKKVHHSARFLLFKLWFCCSCLLFHTGSMLMTFYCRK